MCVCVLKEKAQLRRKDGSSELIKRDDSLRDFIKSQAHGTVSQKRT